jgi:hypothetical protein
MIAGTKIAPGLAIQIGDWLIYQSKIRKLQATLLMIYNPSLLPTALKMQQSEETSVSPLKPGYK